MSREDALDPTHPLWPASRPVFQMPFTITVYTMTTTDQTEWVMFLIIFGGAHCASTATLSIF